MKIVKRFPSLMDHSVLSIPVSSNDTDYVPRMLNDLFHKVKEGTKAIVLVPTDKLERETPVVATYSKSQEIIDKLNEEYSYKWERDGEEDGIVYYSRFGNLEVRIGFSRVSRMKHEWLCLHRKFINKTVEFCNRWGLRPTDLQLSADGFENSVDFGCWHPGTDSSMALLDNKQLIIHTI